MIRCPFGKTARMHCLGAQSSLLLLRPSFPLSAPRYKPAMGIHTTNRRRQSPPTGGPDSCRSTWNHPRLDPHAYYTPPNACSNPCCRCFCGTALLGRRSLILTKSSG